VSKVKSENDILAAILCCLLDGQKFKFRLSNRANRIQHALS